MNGARFGPGTTPVPLQGTQIGSGSIGSPGFVSTGAYPDPLHCGHFILLSLNRVQYWAPGERLHLGKTLTTAFLTTSL
jgi:hypothetical protein